VFWLMLMTVRWYIGGSFGNSNIKCNGQWIWALTTAQIVIFIGNENRHAGTVQ
jgi:hypothetical protein